MVRVKCRYFLLEIIGKDFGNENQLQSSFKNHHLYSVLHKAVETLYGDYGLGTLVMGFTVKLINPYTRIVYLKAKRGPHRLLAAALPFVKQINRIPCSLRTLHVSGTLRSCNKFLRKHSHQQLVHLLKMCATDEQRCAVQASIKGCLKKLKDDVIED